LRIIVGLGNPGPHYAATRHNVGFMVVDQLAAQDTRGRWVDQDHSQAAQVVLAGQELLLVKPQTYMNRSGAAVAAFRQRLGFAPEEVLVLLDDFLLDFGRLRLRRSGSDGGHNGLASILEHLGTPLVPRLRLGIGAPRAGEDPIDYVLGPFGASEQVAGLVERGCQAVETCAREGIDKAMNQFNGLAALV
jgi:PTH1 family peptidyl-tRNA hydrolase